MKVQYANGEVSSVRNDLGRELVRAGIAKEINVPASKPDDTPQWSVHETALGHAAISMKLPVLGQTITYSGRPDLIRPGTFLGRDVPAAILEQYKHLYSVPARRDPISAEIQAHALKKPQPHPENVTMAKAAEKAEKKEREKAKFFQPANPDILCPKLEAGERTELKKPAPAVFVSDDELEEISVRHVAGQI